VPITGQLVQQVGPVIDHPLYEEELLGPVPSGRAQPLAQCPVFDEPSDPSCKAISVIWWDEDGAVAAGGHLGDAAHRGGDEAQARSHCVDERQRGPLGVGGNREDVEGRQQRPDVLALTKELHTAETEPGDPTLQRRALRAVADHDEAGSGMPAFDRGEGIDEQVDSLLWTEHAHGADQQLSLGAQLTPQPSHLWILAVGYGTRRPISNHRHFGCWDPDQLESAGGLRGDGDEAVA
jgi:hypothetical protein